MKAGPIEKVLQALDELGKIIKAQESLIADKDRRIDECRLENNRNIKDIVALESNVDACSSRNASDADRIAGLTLQVDNLNDELKWVYDNSNEQHILKRVAKIVPPEDR